MRGRFLEINRGEKLAFGKTGESITFSSSLFLIFLIFFIILFLAAARRLSAVVLSIGGITLHYPTCYILAEA